MNKGRVDLLSNLFRKLHLMTALPCLPAVGLGTYALRGNEGADSVCSAVDGGYRLIDTANNYENEGVWGKVSGAVPLCVSK